MKLVALYLIFSVLASCAGTKSKSSEESSATGESACTAIDESSISDGSNETRMKFQTLESVDPSDCTVSEEQFRTCTEGEFSDWAGTYKHDSCLVLDPPLLADETTLQRLATSSPFSYSFVNSKNSAVSCSISPNLPAGLTASVVAGSPDTCQILGTPTSPKEETTYTMTATASDGSQSQGTINLWTKGPFITAWNILTTNTLITLPLIQSGDYNFSVNWGDGSDPEQVTSASASHAYAKTGVMIVIIKGKIKGWAFNNTGTSKDLLKSVDSWGSIEFGYSVGAFDGAINLESVPSDKLDLAGTTTLESFFSSCSTMSMLNLSEWNTTPVTNMKSMFNGASGLITLDLTGFNTSAVTDMSAMFSGASLLDSLDVKGFDTVAVTDMSFMFNDVSKITALDVSGFDTSLVTDMASMFNNVSGITSLDVSGFDTSAVTNMNSMFQFASELTSLDVSGFNTSAVTDMSRMFAVASKLTSLNVSGFDTSLVTDMSIMFNVVSGITSLDVSGFDTSLVTDMTSMFNNVSGITSLDVSGFNTSAVTSMSRIFSGASGLTSLDVSGFNTSAVTDMTVMFSRMSSLTALDVTGFDTSLVTEMTSMFSSASSLASLDLTGFDTSLVTEMSAMFRDTSSLTTLDVTGFDISNASVSGNVFINSNAGIVVVCDQGGSPATGTFFGKTCN